MNLSGDNLPAWLPESVRSDPQKAYVLAGLLVVLGLFMARFYFQGGPAPANAAPQAINARKQTDKKSVADQPRVSSPSARKWLKTPIVSVGRNLFTIRPELFPTVVSAQKAQVVVAPGFWDAIEKSRSDQADQKKRRDVLVENLQREAAKLSLQSTVMGPEPQAIIGGSLVKEGSVVASDGQSGVQFRVLSIEPRRVVLERQGIRLELRMLQ